MSLEPEVGAGVEKTVGVNVGIGDDVVTVVGVGVAVTVGVGEGVGIGAVVGVCESSTILIYLAGIYPLLSSDFARKYLLVP